MNVKVIDRTEEFIILEATCEGVPTKRTSVHIDSIADGKTTIEEQIEKCQLDCELRKTRIDAMNKALGTESKGKLE